MIKFPVNFNVLMNHIILDIKVCCFTVKQPASIKYILYASIQ